MNNHTSPYSLAFAPPSLAARYREHDLDAADRARLRTTPHLSERPQWRTSRALLAHLRNAYPGYIPCLSHKHDHALVALGRHKPGADLESLRTRNYFALAAHSFTAQEQDWLRAHPEPQSAFYQLWTLKEALIKAENLRFPAGLRQTGLHGGELFSVSRRPYRWLTLCLDEHWIISAVWPDIGTHRPHFLTATPSTRLMRLAGNLPAPLLKTLTI